MSFEFDCFQLDSLWTLQRLEVTKTHDLKNGVTQIGRNKQAGIIIRSAFANREHCKISITDGGRISVEDEVNFQTKSFILVYDCNIASNFHRF